MTPKVSQLMLICFTFKHSGTSQVTLSYQIQMTEVGISIDSIIALEGYTICGINDFLLHAVTQQTDPVGLCPDPALLRGKGSGDH